jgi:hypothetical protein
MSNHSVCSVLGPCPHLDPDKPCQFENGHCPHQDAILEVADKIRAARGIPGLPDSPFHWMNDWMKAHDEQNDSTKGKEVMDWVWQQPCGAG